MSEKPKKEETKSKKQEEESQLTDEQLEEAPGGYISLPDFSKKVGAIKPSPTDTSLPTYDPTRKVVEMNG